MRKLSAFLLFVLVCHSEKLPLRRYTTADGLAGNRVQWILSDSLGFLWFATTEGLSRFDGYEFKSFTPEQGLPGSYVTQIIETRAGSESSAAAPAMSRRLAGRRSSSIGPRS